MPSPRLAWLSIDIRRLVLRRAPGGVCPLLPLGDEIIERERALPRPEVKVEIGYIISPDGTRESLFAYRENDLMPGDPWPDREMAIAAVAAVLKHPQQEGAETKIHYDQREELLAKFRARKADADKTHGEAREAAGINALSARYNELKERSVAVRDRIKEYRPKTLSGVLAVFDFAEKDVWSEIGLWPDNAIATLRQIVAREGQP